MRCPDQLLLEAAPPYSQSPPPPVQPVYAKQPAVTPIQDPQTPTGETPAEATPSAEAKGADNKDASKDSKEPVAEKEKDAGGGGAAGDSGFDECPDLTPECLKNAVDGAA